MQQRCMLKKMGSIKSWAVLLENEYNKAQLAMLVWFMLSYNKLGTSMTSKNHFVAFVDVVNYIVRGYKKEKRLKRLFH